LLGRVVRWLYRSGHRQLLTKELRGTVAGFRGVALDVGGGPDSPLARSWTKDALRIRVDLTFQDRPELLADARRLPVRSSSVDAVLVSEMLQYVPDPTAVIGEVLRVLRPGGRLAGSTPFLSLGLHGDYYRYSEAGLRHLLVEFRDVDVRPHGNGFGVAWRMVFSRLRILLPLNPLMRNIGRRVDRSLPEGYVFRARKP